jgi:succinate dehydrogenase/fumarate reductase flavoprotein subunit
MQDTAFESIGVIRKESGMTAGLEKMGDMKKEIFSQSTKAKGKVYNREWIAALENEAMLLVMEIIARTSLMRKESRGALYRQDYPDTDNKNWLKNIIVKNKNNQIGLEARQVMATKMQLPKREKTPYMVPQWKFEKKSREKAG